MYVIYQCGGWGYSEGVCVLITCVIYLIEMMYMTYQCLYYCLYYCNICDISNRDDVYDISMRGFAHYEHRRTH